MKTKILNRQQKLNSKGVLKNSSLSIRKFYLIFGHFYKQITFIIFLILTQCKSSQKAPIEQIKKIDNFATMEVLSPNGESYAPHTTESGDRLFYVSGKRPGHDQTQLYVLNIAPKKEKRITFQFGNVNDVNVIRKGSKIIYASETDEVKENYTPMNLLGAGEHSATIESRLNAGILWDQLPQTELYESSLDGDDIVRLTHHQGFDGQISSTPNGTMIYYATWNDKDKKMQLAYLDEKRREHFLPTNGFDEVNPQISFDGKNLLWIRYAKDRKTSTIIWADSLGKKPMPVGLNSELIAEAVWTPNSKEIIFTQLNSETGNFQLMGISRDGTCTRVIAAAPASLRHPFVSADSKWIYFSLVSAKEIQVARLPMPQGACTPLPTPIQSK